jgi:hypothetical protein
MEEVLAGGFRYPYWHYIEGVGISGRDSYNPTVIEGISGILFYDSVVSVSKNEMFFYFFLFFP